MWKRVLHKGMELVRMSNAPIGNEEAMAKVKELMEAKEMADEINLGAQAEDVVEIDYESESGKVYKGKIKFKRANVMDNMRMGGIKTQILREAGIVDRNLADESILMMAQSICTLEVVIDKCPEWLLDVRKVEDPDVLFHVYGRYMAWQYSFRLEDGSES